MNQPDHYTAKHPGTGDDIYYPTAEEIESLHCRFRRAAEVLAHGNGPWKVTQNAMRALREAVKEFAEFDAKFSPRKDKKP